jgi:hypothetical protein
MNGNENARDTRKHALHSFMIVLYVMFYEDFHGRWISMYMFMNK